MNKEFRHAAMIVSVLFGLFGIGLFNGACWISSGLHPPTGKLILAILTVAMAVMVVLHRLKRNGDFLVAFYLIVAVFLGIVSSFLKLDITTVIVMSIMVGALTTIGTLPRNDHPASR